MAQLITCPDCNKHLQVPENLLGKHVQCPECQHTFTAKGPETVTIGGNTGTTATPPPPQPSEPKVPEWDKRSGSRSGDSDRKRPSRDEDEFDDRDDEFERPRRRRSGASRGSFMPHRGGMILTFGLLGIILMWLIPLVPLIFAILAWVMGNADLTEMRSGRMDPEGEGMTQAGRVMGMISTFLHIAGVVLFCVIFGCMFGAAAIGGAGRRPPRRF